MSIIFDLQIELDEEKNKITFYAKSNCPVSKKYNDKYYYVEYNHFKPGELKEVIQDLSISSSFMAEVLLRYLRGLKRKVLKKKVTKS